MKDSQLDYANELLKQYGIEVKVDTVEEKSIDIIRDGVMYRFTTSYKRSRQVPEKDIVLPRINYRMNALIEFDDVIISLCNDGITGFKKKGK